MSDQWQEEYKRGGIAGKKWASEYASWEELHKLVEIAREHERQEQEEHDDRTEHDPYYLGSLSPNVIHNEKVVDLIIRGLIVSNGQSSTEFWKMLGVSGDIGGWDQNFMEGFVNGTLNVAIHTPVAPTAKGASI